MFGLDKPRVEDASGILQELAADWRELLAGSEGFLTSFERTGLFRREVIWGEMVSQAYSIFSAGFDECIGCYGEPHRTPL